LELQDYIFTGAGAAGLMTAYRMSQDPFFADKSILLIDLDIKDTNDRTWCYWEPMGGEWDHILTKTWNHIGVASDGYRETIDTGKYTYKMLSGLDFYTTVKGELANHPKIKFVQDFVVNVVDKNFAVHVECTKRNYQAKYVFNSIFDPSTLKPRSVFPYLSQHFIGWFVETERPVFDIDCATFMDFDLQQQGNTRFMYVLPFSPTKALVEYTLFSKQLLPDHDYEDAIASYLDKMNVGQYKVYDTERGNIPMTTYPLWERNSAKIIHIGTAGGWSKACTGYTFANTMSYSKTLTQNIKKGKFSINIQNRWWYYDHIMLRVLSKDNSLGSYFFTSIFKSNKISSIFRFLDSRSSLKEDLDIMLRAKPRLPFIKEAILSIPTFIRSFF
jgi:lycopene beta-cyclase